MLPKIVEDDTQCSILDIEARIKSVEAASLIFQSSSEDHFSLNLAKEFYKFIMEGTSDDFKKRVINAKRDLF